MVCSGGCSNVGVWFVVVGVVMLAVCGCSHVGGGWFVVVDVVMLVCGL